MAKNTAKKLSQNQWGYNRGSLLAAASKLKVDGKAAEVLVHSDKASEKKTPKDWLAAFPESKSILRILETNEGVRVILNPMKGEDPEKDPRLKMNPATRLRDGMGLVVATLERMDVKKATIRLELNDEFLQSALLGLEVALYRFKRFFRGDDAGFSLTIINRGKTLTADALEKATALGQSVNVARHLVNLPPNLLDPETYSEFVKALLKGVAGVKVEVWDAAKLKKENCGLHLAVGAGSHAAPALVHVSYRPKGAKGAPVALVGKGITFDTGGLDIKPSSGMRLMKKDMGGSAAVLGVLYWAAQSKLNVPIDAYLALAENAISQNSFRPSDVIVSRSGLSVEIHNTDAEGRLVLADALDVAVTAKEKPRVVIDVATLTGAIKVALGSQLAGLFANDSKLASSLESAGREAGDLMWTMPLFRKYGPQMSSNFADMVNATDGFGGAVTAALFLEKFVKDVPWAHLDIYAWKDSADGCFLEGGGSGQAVCALANWLSL